MVFRVFEYNWIFLKKTIAFSLRVNLTFYFNDFIEEMESGYLLHY